MVNIVRYADAVKQIHKVADRWYDISWRDMLYSFIDQTIADYFNWFTILDLTEDQDLLNTYVRIFRQACSKSVRTTIKATSKVRQ